jgi:hypothetical protein
MCEQMNLQAVIVESRQLRKPFNRTFNPCGFRSRTPVQE